MAPSTICTCTAPRLHWTSTSTSVQPIRNEWREANSFAVFRRRSPSSFVASLQSTAPYIPLNIRKLLKVIVGRLGCWIAKLQNGTLAVRWNLFIFWHGRFGTFFQALIVCVFLVDFCRIPHFLMKYSMVYHYVDCLGAYGQDLLSSGNRMSWWHNIHKEGFLINAAAPGPIESPFAFYVSWISNTMDLSLDTASMDNLAVMFVTANVGTLFEMVREEWKTRRCLEKRGRIFHRASTSRITMPSGWVWAVLNEKLLRTNTPPSGSERHSRKQVVFRLIRCLSQDDHFNH